MVSVSPAFNLSAFSIVMVEELPSLFVNVIFNLLSFVNLSATLNLALSELPNKSCNLMLLSCFS